MKNKLTSTMNSIFITFLVIFTVIPFVLIIKEAFFTIDGQFTFANFATFFERDYIVLAINSFYYAAVITLFTLIMAIPAAYVLTKLKHATLILILILIPSWINLLLKAYSFIGILATDGIVNQTLGLFGIPNVQWLFSVKGFIIVAVYIFVPFMILPIYNSMSKIPKNIINASNDLGANEFQTLFKIIMPMAVNGIISGIQVVFIPSLSLFMLTRIITGSKVMTLGSVIEQHFLVSGNWGMGSTIAAMLVLMMFLIIFVTSHLGKIRKLTSRIGGDNNEKEMA